MDSAAPLEPSSLISLDRPAFLASPQSFGTLLNHHPHVHGLVSAGVFDPEGEFHEDLDLDFDFESLELSFRDAVLERFAKLGRLDEERAALIRSWPHSGFQVHAEPVIPTGSPSELESLLQYFERAPVSLKRITLLDTGMVLYQGKYHPGLGRDHQLVTGLEFLAMLVPHIQLRYECKARLYGALSTTFRKRVGWIAPRGSEKTSEASSSEEPESDSTRARRRGWAELIRKVWLDDPEICPNCGGTFKIVAALTSPAQDDIIRAILDARGEWAPPWQGRAPPARSPTADDEDDEGDERIVEIEVDPGRIWTED